MSTSFDTPRVLGHHNPFASFQDTTDDPLASGSGGGGFASYSSTGNGMNTTSTTDPWSSSYYIPPVPSTSSSSSNVQLAGILDEDTIPSIYLQAWNAASSSSASSTSTSFGSTSNNGNTISLAVLQKVLSNCAALSAGETEKIITLVSGSSGNLASSYTTASGSGNITGITTTSPPTSPFKLYGVNTSIESNRDTGTIGNGRISKLEFYIALALAALAQQKEALSIQNISSRMNNLPIPDLDLSVLQGQNSVGSTLTRRPSNTRQPSSPSTPYRSHKISTGSSTGDPWNNNNNHGSYIGQTPTHRAEGRFSNNTSNNNDPFRTSPTSNYASSSATTQPPMYSPPRTTRMTENGYSSFPSFNEEEDDENNITTIRGEESSSSEAALLSLPPFQSSLKLNQEFKRILVIQEETLKGNFLNRYTCYKVIFINQQNQNNDNDNIEVHRRYSDWIALNDYLELKYEGRIKLSLPPKRMGISSRHVHIGSDVQFLERRRRGLNRYIEFIANHPIMKHDKAVKAFLFEKNMDYSTWRKNNSSILNIDNKVNDEASLIGKLTNSQESLIPTSFENIIKTLKEELPGLIDTLTRFCSLIERINFRNQQNENDLMRARLAFDSFGEIYRGLSSDKNSNTGLTGGEARIESGRPREIEEETAFFNRDISKMSERIGNIIELNEGINNERIEGLERDFKLQRDLWRSLFNLINKYDNKLKFDNIDKIKKRIESNQSRYSILNSNIAKSTNNSNENRKVKEEEEMKKIIKNIETDQNEIERLLNRRIFYKWCLMGEIRLIWRYSTLMRVEMSDWIIREHKHYKHISRIWEDLEDALAVVN